MMALRAGVKVFRQPDAWQHFRKTLRRYAINLIQRARRVDAAALAAEWEVRGVDLSYWQGEVDFDRLALAADFVIIRAGYGNDYFDPRMAEYVQGSAERNIPWGLYWYVKPGKDFRKHAQNFWNIWKSNGGQIYPTFDVEESGGLDKIGLESWLKKMYDLFNILAGRKYGNEMTYTSAGFLDRAMGLTNWLKRTQLWVAHWTTAPQPILPREWGVPGYTWEIWQWSSTGKGSDYGVSSRFVDLNRYNGTRAEFEAEFGVILPEPPGEDEMRFRAIAQPHLNVRAGPGTNYADVGDMAPGTEFAILDVQAGYPSCSTWIQVKGGQYDGKWVCLTLNGTYYAEKMV